MPLLLLPSLLAAFNFASAPLLMPAAITRPVEDDVEDDEFELSPPALSSSFKPSSSSRQSSREMELLTSLLLMVLLTVPVVAPSTLRTFILGTLLLRELLVLAAMDFREDSDRRVVFVVDVELPVSVELLLLVAVIAVDVVAVVVAVGDDPVVL